MEKIKFNNKWYGWKPDVPDFRDFNFSISEKAIKNLPESIDLRNSSLPIFNQGALGSCTGNAISTIHMFNQLKLKKRNYFVPSRLFIYYNERVMEGTVNFDSGAMIRDGIKSIVKFGACSESNCPYIIRDFTKKPSRRSFSEALKNQAIEYRRIPQVLDQLKGCLAEGYPFVFGFAVYTSFESKEVSKTGIVKMPITSERLLGGHAVIAMGYNNQNKTFIIQNSWGKDWGQKGFFTMPYEYLSDIRLASDFWTVRLVEV